jgi:hypothetical protein
MGASMALLQVRYQYDNVCRLKSVQSRIKDGVVPIRIKNMKFYYLRYFNFLIYIQSLSPPKAQGLAMSLYLFLNWNFSAVATGMTKLQFCFCY